MRRLNAGEHNFTSWDGTHLFYRSWHPRCLQGKALVLFHSGHEHSGRLAHVVEALDIPGVSFFAWDARGHGLSPGKRGYADSFRDLVRDADSFIGALISEFDIPEEDIAVLGHPFFQLPSELLGIGLGYCPDRSPHLAQEVGLV